MHASPIQVNYIFEIENAYPFIRRLSAKALRARREKNSLDEHKQREFKAKNQAVVDEIEVCLHIILCRIYQSHEPTFCAHIISAKPLLQGKGHNEDMKQSVRSLSNQVIDLKKDLAQAHAALKLQTEEASSTLQEMVLKEVSTLKDTVSSVVTQVTI